MLVWLFTAFAAPRILSIPLPDSDGIRVVQVADSEIAIQAVTVNVHPTVHPSFGAAASAAPYPLLPPWHADALELQAWATDRARAALMDPARTRSLERALRQTTDEDTRLDLAIAASLAGLPLDDADLSPDLQERASFGAASYRARHRLLGRWADDHQAQQHGLRDRFLVEHPKAGALVPRSTIEHDVYGGDASPTPFSEAGPTTGGLYGAVRIAVAALPVFAEGPPNPEEAVVTPEVTESGSAFYSACLRAIATMSAPGPHGEHLRKRCSAGLAKRPLPWSSAPVQQRFAKRWVHGQPFEGQDLVGVAIHDVEFRYSTPPRTLAPDGTSIDVSIGAARRSLLVPVFRPFRSDDLHGDTQAPPPSSWSCSSVSSTAGLWFIGWAMARRRQENS